jgi:hypothetical protein
VVKVADCREEMVWLDLAFEGSWYERVSRVCESERGDGIARRV